MIPAVISFHAQDFTEDFTQIFLVEDNWRFHFTELFLNMVFIFKLYDVHNFKDNILGNPLSFPLSYGCNNKQSNFHYQLFVLLEA